MLKRPADSRSSGRSGRIRRTGSAIASAKLAEVFLHHLAREGVVARGHRRVSGEDIGRGHDLEGGIKIELLLYNSQADAFEREEGRVALVHVEDLRVDPERAERFHAADAEHDLLAHPHFEIAAVELRRDQAIFRRVLRRCRYRAGKD